MKRTDLWRLLALILALVMVLGCLAGCDGNGVGNDDDDDEVEELRDGLEKHEYDGLTFYLGKDFKEGKYDGESYWTDGDVYVVAASDPLSYLHEDVESVEELLDVLVADLKEGFDGEIEKGKANGTYYMVVEGLAVGGEIEGLSEDATSVIGVYMEGDTMGLIGVMAEDFEKYEDDMIAYATLGELEDCYKDEDPDDKDPDDEDPDDEPKKDLGPTQEHDLAGLHFYLPEGAENTDGQGDDHAEFKYRGVQYYEGVKFVVSRTALDELDLDEPTAEAVAEFLHGRMEGALDELELTSHNGVPVITMADGDMIGAGGVYVGGGFYWLVEATYKGRDVATEALVRIVSNGWIVADEITAPAETTDEIVCAGLYLHMDKSYEVEGNGTVEVTAAEGHDTLSVSRGENARGETAEEMLVSYQILLETSGQYVERLERNGMGYLVYENQPGLTSLKTYYVQGGYYWGVSIFGKYDEAELEDIADQITSGRIDADEFTRVETTDEIVCEGLHLHMDKSYEVKGNGTVAVVATEGDDRLHVTYLDSTGKTAEEILNIIMNNISGSGRNVELLERNGMGYLVSVDFGLASLYTVYVQGGHYWRVEISGMYDEAELEAIADQITSGYFE